MGFENVSATAEKTYTADEIAPIWEQYREEFPVTRELIYLNHAAVSPLSRRASEAMRAHAEDTLLYGSWHYDRWLEAYSRLRTAAARLINAAPGEIAIVKNTSEGIATVALGLAWRPGDRIVVFREEFPSNYYPWLRLEARGVKLTWLSIHDPLDKVAEAVRGARLLAISFVNYLDGFRVNLEAIGKLCRSESCFFFVDAIQGMGAYPIDVERCNIDALAADGHKWMLGPEGNAILYVRTKWLDEIEPLEFGWSTPANYADFASRDMRLRPDAGRYECGTLNTIGCHGHQAALELLVEVGIDKVADAVDAVASRLATAVEAKGYELMLARTPKTGSGIVSFRHPSLDARAIVSGLKRECILAAPRQGWVRMAPHFYVSPGDIDQVVRALPTV